MHVATGSYDDSPPSLPAAATTSTCAFVKGRCPGELTAGGLGAPPGCVEPLCAVRFLSGATLVRSDVYSFIEHAAHVRVEQHGIFGEVAARDRALHDLQIHSRWAHVHNTQQGHRPESEQGDRGRMRRATGLVRAEEPLSQGGESQMARRVPTLCVAWVATHRASGCAAQSVSTHLQHAQRGAAVGAESAGVSAREAGRWHEGGVRVVP